MFSSYRSIASSISSTGSTSRAPPENELFCFNDYHHHHQRPILVNAQNFNGNTSPMPNLHAPVSTPVSKTAMDLSRVKLESCDDDSSSTSITILSNFNNCHHQLHKIEYGGLQIDTSVETLHQPTSDVYSNTRSSYDISPGRETSYCSKSSTPNSTISSPGAATNGQQNGLYPSPEILSCLPPGFENKVFFPPSAINPSKSGNSGRYNKRRDNPELEKRRVHYCDFPGT